MSKTNTLETQILEKLFQNTAFPWDANGSLYVSLHTADPGEGGDQSTNEASYGGYARQAVARSSSGWTVTGNQVANAGAVTFPDRNNVGTESITHVGIGTDASGAGSLLYKGALTLPIAVTLTFGPQFAAGTLVVEED